MNRIAAFVATLTLLASCTAAANAERHFMVDPGTGEEMDAITRETSALSAEVRAKIGAMLNAM